MCFRALIRRSPWVRGAFLVLLLIFILVCGIHLAGVHHDSDSDGLGLVDRLPIVLLVAFLGLVLTALDRRRSQEASDIGQVRRVILQAVAFDASSFRMVMPLRC